MASPSPPSTVVLPWLIPVVGANVAAVLMAAVLFSKQQALPRQLQQQQQTQPRATAVATAPTEQQKPPPPPPPPQQQQQGRRAQAQAAPAAAPALPDELAWLRAPPGASPPPFHNASGIIRGQKAPVYVIGDAEGQLHVIYDLLIKEGLVKEAPGAPGAPPSGRLVWTGGDAMVVQLGDQIDVGTRVKEGTRPTSPDDPKRIELDLATMLFMEYLRVLSNGRVLSLVGNHEWLNVVGRLNHVSAANSALLRGADRVDAFRYDGVLGRILRVRHLALRIDDVLFCHAGLTGKGVQDIAQAMGASSGGPLPALDDMVKACNAGLLDRDAYEQGSHGHVRTRSARFAKLADELLWARTWYCDIDSNYRCVGLRAEFNERIIPGKVDVREWLKGQGVSAMFVGHNTVDVPRMFPTAKSAEASMPLPLSYTPPAPAHALPTSTASGAEHAAVVLTDVGPARREQGGIAFIKTWLDETSGTRVLEPRVHACNGQACAFYPWTAALMQLLR